jgi:hypothetical protein
MEEQKPSVPRVPIPSRRRFIQGASIITAAAVAEAAAHSRYGRAASWLLSDAQAATAPGSSEAITSPEKTPELVTERNVVFKGLKPRPGKEATARLESVVLTPVDEQILGSVPIVPGKEEYVSYNVPATKEEAKEGDYQRGGVRVVDANLAGNYAGYPEFIPVYAAPKGDDLVIDLSESARNIGAHQMGIVDLEARLAREQIHPQRPIGVAVVDSGINLNAPAIKEAVSAGVIKYSEGYNAAEPDQPPSFDYEGHGTAVADYIRRISPQQTGFLSIYPVSIPDHSGNWGERGETWGRIQKAIRWAADHPDISLVNLSCYAYPQKSDPDFPEQAQIAKELLKYANEKGTFVIGAAGNDAKQVGEWVTDIAKNLHAGAMNSSGRIAGYSNSNPDVVAPTEVPATVSLALHGGMSQQEVEELKQFKALTSLNGTSAASPGVVAVAAWAGMYTAAPMREIIDTINGPEGTTDIYGPDSPQNARDGHGLVMANKVYDALKAKGY